MHTESLQSTQTQEQSQAQTPAQEPQPALKPRYDIYLGIHKALRLLMSETLLALGRCDPRSDTEVNTAVGQLEGLLDICTVHLADENAFIHPALERVRPGFSERIAHEHVEHQEAIADLRDLAGFVRVQQGPVRGSALNRLYRACVLFVAENFEHMDYEETEHNRVLWAGYTDAQLLALEAELIAEVPPEAMMAMVPWFMRSLNAVELAGMMGGIRIGMPAPAFEAVLGIAAEVLSAERHATLLADLGLPPKTVTA